MIQHWYQSVFVLKGPQTQNTTLKSLEIHFFTSKIYLKSQGLWSVPKSDQDPSPFGAKSYFAQIRANAKRYLAQIETNVKRYMGQIEANN